MGRTAFSGTAVTSTENVIVKNGKNKVIHIVDANISEKVVAAVGVHKVGMGNTGRTSPNQMLVNSLEKSTFRQD